MTPVLVTPWWLRCQTNAAHSSPTPRPLIAQGQPNVDDDGHVIARLIISSLLLCLHPTSPRVIFWWDVGFEYGRRFCFGLLWRRYKRVLDEYAVENCVGSVGSKNEIPDTVSSSSKRFEILEDLPLLNNLRYCWVGLLLVTQSTYFTVKVMRNWYNGEW